MNNLPAHSPLGASSAERWLNCTGSPALITLLRLKSEDSDYSILGTAAHAAAAHITENNMDAWEVVGEEFEGVVVDDPMAVAIQVWKDTVRPLLPDHGPYGIEDLIYRPELHRHFHGTADFWALDDGVLHVADYKHGEGIAVEVKDNPQFSYYAFGIIDMLELPGQTPVEIKVVQPRAPHTDGAVRAWRASAGEIRRWGTEVLLPGMRRTETDMTLTAGEWCRFCPAKRVCPVLRDNLNTLAACGLDAGALRHQEAQELSSMKQSFAGVKKLMAAVDNEIHTRLQNKQPVPGYKLVQSRADRVFKPEAAEIFKARLGDEAFEPAKLKSPAQMEKVSSEAKGLVKQWAYTPQNGTTVAEISDRRMEVEVKDASDVLGPAAQKFLASLPD